MRAARVHKIYFTSARYALKSLSLFLRIWAGMVLMPCAASVQITALPLPISMLSCMPIPRTGFSIAALFFKAVSMFLRFC